MTDTTNATLDSGERITVFFKCDPKLHKECSKNCQVGCFHTLKKECMEKGNDLYFYQERKIK
jgi:hypothetical protein